MEIDFETWQAIQGEVRKFVDSGSGSNSQDILTLDVTRPNIHDNKADFLSESAAVESAIEGANRTIAALHPDGRETDAKVADMVDRLQAALDSHARRKFSKDPPTSISELVRKNAAETGFYYNSLLSLLDLSDALEDRRNELRDQERQFWAVKNRPPNYYARAIALRMARLYARANGERPTFGTARDGGHPNTEFGRTLEFVFGALGIEGGVKHPARYAISQLTEEDLQPRPGNALRDVLGKGDGLPPTRNALAMIADQLLKGSKS